MAHRIAPRPVTVKPPPMISKAVRASARGERCTLRIPGVCNDYPETTVFAHYRLFGWMGLGEKVDPLGCYACSACHRLIDLEDRGLDVVSYEDLLRAFGETIVRLIRNGAMKFGDGK